MYEDNLAKPNDQFQVPRLPSGEGVAATPSEMADNHLSSVTPLLPNLRSGDRGLRCRASPKLNLGPQSAALAGGFFGPSTGGAAKWWILASKGC
jgi:hypothetical protein